MRLRRWIPAAVAVLVVLGVVTAAGWPVYVRPTTEQASTGDPADVVIALAGKSTDTAYYAKRLVLEGKAKHALLSNPYGQYVPEMVALCPATPPPDTTCFFPSPNTTRGEARELARLAQQNGWDDVIVVTPTYHISRARYVFDRCYSGRLRMVDPDVGIPFYAWPREYAYQTVGFLKASLQRGC